MGFNSGWYGERGHIDLTKYSVCIQEKLLRVSSRCYRSRALKGVRLQIYSCLLPIYSYLLSWCPLWDPLTRLCCDTTHYRRLILILAANLVSTELLPTFQNCSNSYRHDNLLTLFLMETIEDHYLTKPASLPSSNIISRRPFETGTLIHLELPLVHEFE
jgi:hypothetical protein